MYKSQKSDKTVSWLQLCQQLSVPLYQPFKAIKTLSGRPNADSPLVQPLRRWTNGKPSLGRLSMSALPGVGPVYPLNLQSLVLSRKTPERRQRVESGPWLMGRYTSIYGNKMAALRGAFTAAEYGLAILMHFQWSTWLCCCPWRGYLSHLVSASSHFFHRQNTQA